MTDKFTTLLDALKHRGQHMAEKPAFVFRDSQGGRQVQTFGSIYSHGGRYAAMLKAGGMGRGHLVVNTLPNCPERVVVEMGILMSGAASVNAQYLLADGSDLLATIRRSRASGIVVDPDVTYSPWHILQKHVSLTGDDDVVSSELPNLKKVFFVKRAQQSQVDFLHRLDASDDWFMAGDVEADDACSVFTTSGTSGFSKLVVHTHHGLITALLRDNPVFVSVTDKHVSFSMSPLGWLGGYAGNEILTGTVRVLADTHDGSPTDLIDFMLQVFKEEKVSHTFIPAPYLQVLVDRVRKMKTMGGKTVDSNNPGTVLRILERVTLGGQPINRTLVQTASLLARAVFVLYGSSETFLAASFTVPDPNTYQDFDCGVVPKSGSIKIVSPKDESKELPVGQKGMILFKRSVMMKEYLHDPDATAAAFTHDGFFRTGDIGRLDENGHVMVEGRGNDAIMKGPCIFYPGWLEERIRACPGVQDVMVVGVPDPGANEEICACVTLKSDQVTVQQVQDFVEKDISTSDEELISPKPRHYLIFDSFPVTNTGKPHRTVVKQQATARLSVSSDD